MADKSGAWGGPAPKPPSAPWPCCCDPNSPVGCAVPAGAPKPPPKEKPVPVAGVEAPPKSEGADEGAAAPKSEGAAAGVLAAPNSEGVLAAPNSEGWAAAAGCCCCPKPAAGAAGVKEKEGVVVGPNKPAETEEDAS